MHARVHTVKRTTLACVVHSCSPSTQEAEAGGGLKIQGQLGLYCLKKRSKRKRREGRKKERRERGGQDPVPAPVKTSAGLRINCAATLGNCCSVSAPRRKDRCPSQQTAGTAE